MGGGGSSTGDGRHVYDGGMGARPEVIAAYGPILYGTGFHAHTTGFFRALHRRHPVAAMNADRQAAPADVPPDVLEMLENGRRLGTAPADVGIGIGPFEAIPRIAGRKRIGFVVWEPSRLLPFDVRLIRTLDEVWTPTEWGKRLLVANGIPEEAVSVVPEGVDVTRFIPAQERTPRQRFRFLCVGRWQVRKGIEELIVAYRREFAPDEPVELVLRCILTGQEPPVEARLAALRGPHAPILGISRQLAPEALVELYQSADAFVLPTKAEGWGLPIVEAMACGLPAIVTNCSAPAEFLDDSIAYPIRVAGMVPAYDPVWYPDREAYGEWAQPDVEHLQVLMRHVFEHRDEARAVGERARAAVGARLTWDHAAQTACQVLGLHSGA
jgi:glycosyltransferase involved in cell wall biosynthesis